MHIHELGHVVLYVTNLERSAKFYRDTLGFKEIMHEKGAAAFSGGRTHHELLLIEIGGEPKEKRLPETGLYHIGFKIGDTDEELKTAYRELKEKGVTMVGSADHYVTHSLYILDPDGNELELYIDASDEWKRDPSVIGKPTRPLNLL
jgi:catechol-2,3-dioxygenase